MTITTYANDCHLERFSVHYRMPHVQLEHLATIAEAKAIYQMGYHILCRESKWRQCSEVMQDTNLSDLAYQFHDVADGCKNLDAAMRASNPYLASKMPESKLEFWVMLNNRKIDQDGSTIRLYRGNVYISDTVWAGLWGNAYLLSPGNGRYCRKFYLNHQVCFHRETAMQYIQQQVQEHPEYGLHLNGRIWWNGGKLAPRDKR